MSKKKRKVSKREINRRKKQRIISILDKATVNEFKKLQAK